jgi:hypothetical protein
MSRKTKKLRINKKKGNNKRNNKRRTRKIYGGVSIQDKFDELTNNDGEYDMRVLDDILKKYNDETIDTFEEEFNIEYEKISKIFLDNTQTHTKEDLERLGFRLQLFTDIKITKEIDEFIKLINIDKNENSENHDMDELDNKVLIQKNKPVNLNEFITNYQTARKSLPKDADKERLKLRDNLYNLWVEYLSIDAGEMDDNSELVSNVDETENKEKEKSEENATTESLPVSRFPKLPSLPKFSGISFPSLNKTQKKRPDIQKEQAYEREIALKSRKERLIKDINQILKEGESGLNITDFIKEDNPDGKASFNTAIGENSDSRLTQLVESLDALVNLKSSAETTVDLLQPEAVKVPSSGIFNKLKNLTQKKRPIDTASPSPVTPPEVLASSFVTLANALSPVTQDTMKNMLMKNIEKYFKGNQSQVKLLEEKVNNLDPEEQKTVISNLHNFLKKQGDKLTFDNMSSAITLGKRSISTQTGKLYVTEADKSAIKQLNGCDGILGDRTNERRVKFDENITEYLKSPQKYWTDVEKLQNGSENALLTDLNYIVENCIDNATVTAAKKILNERMVIVGGLIAAGIIRSPLIALTKLGSTVTERVGQAGVEYKNKLLAAIKALEDNTECTLTTEIKEQLTAYKTLCNEDTPLSTDLIQSDYIGFEAGLRERILKCPGIKEEARLVLADYENRASKMLTYAQRATGTFTRKNSDGDSKISGYLDKVEAFSETDPTGESPLKKHIEELRGAILKHDNAIIEKNVDIILVWLANEKTDEENKIKVEQEKLKETKSVADKAVINANIKKSFERINNEIRLHERNINSIMGISQIKRSTTLKNRRVSEKIDNTPKPQFNNSIKIGDVLPEFDIKLTENGVAKEFVPIVIEGDEISIDGKRLDGDDDERRVAWNNARSTILGLQEQNGNALPRFDDGKITFNVYKNGKVTIQLNDGPIVYINNKEELEKFKKNSRNPTKKPSVLSRISNPFTTMFGPKK